MMLAVASSTPGMGWRPLRVICRDSRRESAAQNASSGQSACLAVSRRSTNVFADAGTQGIAARRDREFAPAKFVHRLQDVNAVGTDCGALDEAAIIGD